MLSILSEESQIPFIQDGGGLVVTWGGGKGATRKTCYWGTVLFLGGETTLGHKLGMAAEHCENTETTEIFILTG